MLGAGALYGVLEAAFGLVLVLATAVRGHPPPAWLDAVKAVSKTDVGAFGARWVLHATVGLARTRKLFVGIGLVIEGGVRAALLVAVARGNRTATAVAGAVFGVVAAGGLIVAGANPPIGTFVVAALNVTLAVAVALQLRDVLASQPRRA